MHSIATPSTNLYSLLSRVTIVVLMLAVPVLAVPAMQAPPSHIIEAPAPQSKGLGFVLTVILQKR